MVDPSNARNKTGVILEELKNYAMTNPEHAFQIINEIMQDIDHTRLFIKFTSMTNMAKILDERWVDVMTDMVEMDKHNASIESESELEPKLEPETESETNKHESCD